MEKPFTINFSKGSSALATNINHLEELPISLRELGFQQPRSTLVLVGGAGGLSKTDMKTLRPLFVEALAPLAEKLGAVVIDGGTDAGVMRLMGRARTETGAGFPLVGVVIKGIFHLSDASPTPETVSLEPNHTHFITIPGSDWGDESPWLDHVAREIAQNASSVTVLINGGEIARKDVELSLSAGRPVLVVAGTGRLADEMAATPGRSPLLHIINLKSGLCKVTDTIISFLKENSNGKV